MSKPPCRDPEDWSDSEVEELLDFDRPCMKDVTIGVARDLLAHFQGEAKEVYALLKCESKKDWENRKRTMPDFAFSGAAADYSPETCARTASGKAVVR